MIAGIMQKLGIKAHTSVKGATAQPPRSKVSSPADNRAAVTFGEGSNWLRLATQTCPEIPRLIFSESGSIYEVEGVLGRGGLGVVLKATRLQDGLGVAIKLAAFEGDGEAKELIRREARILSRLSHAHIVRLVESGVMMNGEPFLAIQYLDGETLEQILRKGGPVSVSRAREICLQVADAMDYAHRRGVLHRDLKPANIMISNRGGLDRATVLDFGISQLVADGPLNRKQITSGSLFYLSPEQALQQPTTHRSDIYQLALVLFECVTGRLPFKLSFGEAIQYRVGGEIIPADPAVQSRLSPPLKKVLETGLSREQWRRPPSMSTFMGQLRQIKPAAATAA